MSHHLKPIFLLATVILLGTSCQSITTEYRKTREFETRKAYQFETDNARRAFYAVLNKIQSQEKPVLKEDLQSPWEIEKIYTNRTPEAIFNDLAQAFDTNQDGIISSAEASIQFDLTFRENYGLQQPGPFNQLLDIMQFRDEGASLALINANFEKITQQRVTELAQKFQYPAEAILVEKMKHEITRKGDGFSALIFVNYVYNFRTHLRLEAQTLPISTNTPPLSPDLEPQP